MLAFTPFKGLVEVEVRIGFRFRLGFWVRVTGLVVRVRDLFGQKTAMPHILMDISGGATHGVGLVMRRNMPWKKSNYQLAFHAEAHCQQGYQGLKNQKRP